VASVSAILFFVLALQTGVTSLDGEKRFHQLCKNFCLLLTGQSSNNV
jgi:E3 ubiquitin-protein ligase RNF139